MYRKRMANLLLKTLHCHETEDYTGSDEIRLWVSAIRNHEYYRDMNTGQIWDINDEVPFTVKAKIEVWDLDAGRWWDPHDRLGTHHAVDSMAGQGEKAAIFDAQGARYELRYEVFADSPGARSGGGSRGGVGKIRGK